MQQPSLNFHQILFCKMLQQNSPTNFQYYTKKKTCF